MSDELAKVEALPEVDEIEAREDWRVTTLQGADWALSRISDIEAELAEDSALAAAHLTRIRALLEKKRERAERGIAYFRSRLEGFARDNKETLLKGGRSKSRKLFHGSIGWKSARGGLKVDDEATLLAWCQAQPVEAGLIRYTEAVNKNALKAFAEANKLIPPGCVEEQATEEFYVKTTSLALAKGDANGDE